MNDNQKIIDSFKQSQDYKDICYMIDHFSRTDIMISCLEDLGYKIGLDLVTSKDKPELKKIIIGKKNEIRVQITKYKDKHVICAIVKS